MKILGLLYPVNGKTALRTEELRESGHTFGRWLQSIVDQLDWKIYDYDANNNLKPEADIDAVVVFGRVSKSRLQAVAAHYEKAPPIFWSDVYSNNLDLIRDLCKVMGGN
jgi:hypothetical protein